MKLAIISSLLFLMGCGDKESTKELPKDLMKYHIGQKLMVIGDDFYNGCVGTATLVDMWCHSKDKKRMQPKYTMNDVKCPGIKDKMWIRAAQDSLKSVK